MEEKSKKYTLTGGYFLYQILEAINEQGKRRGYNNGGITQSNCFKALILLGQGERKIYCEEKTMREDTSKYKSCKLDPAAWMPFTNVDYINTLNDMIENHYDEILNETVKWGEKYLDLRQHANQLGKAILEMLLYDENLIPENVYLYVKANGKRICLSELFNEEIIDIQPLILGVWHYIVNNNLPNDFRPGSKYSKAGIERNIIENIGNNGEFSCYINVLQVVEKHISDESSSKAEDLDNEVEVDDGEESASSDSAQHSFEGQTVNQILNTPAIINQHAEKIVNIGHVDHLEI